MLVIEQVREMEQTMLVEADAQKNEAAREHIYELFNYISDWEAIWTNSEFDTDETIQN